VLAYPDATIYDCSEDSLSEIQYEDADPVRLTQGFLGDRERYLHQLLND
jgi:predicted ATPase